MYILVFFIELLYCKTSQFFCISFSIINEGWQNKTNEINSIIDDWDIRVLNISEVNFLKEVQGCIQKPQKSMMGCFVKIGDVYKLLTIFTKRPILDVWQDSEYPSTVFTWNVDQSPHIIEE